MTSDEYRTAIAALGLTQASAARLLGVTGRTSRRWAAGDRPVSEPAARFLRYLIATGKTGDDIREKLGMKPEGED